MSGSERPDSSTALAVAYLPWLFKHVVRSWLYGARLTQYRGLTPDAELVAVSVLLHDLGLALGSGHRSRLCPLAQYGGAPRRDSLGFDRPPHDRIDCAA
jgi:hypothetical protein